MNAVVHENFPHSWTAQVFKTAPLIAPARQFVYPLHVAGEEDAMNRGAMLVEVKPAAGGLFLATCALGFQEASLPSEVFAPAAAARGVDSGCAGRWVAAAGGVSQHCGDRGERHCLAE